MKQQPLISIIIPIFNAERYLKRCIDSVLAQKGVNLEIILVNDGSTDSSAYLCNSYAENHHCIKVIHQDNRGASVARNVGIKKAQGMWVAFVDSDDFIKPNMYEQMLTLAYQKGADAVFCHCIQWHNNEKNSYLSLPPCFPNNKQKTIDKQLNTLTGLIYTLIVKRELLLTNNIFFPTNITYSEDYYMVMSIKVCANKTAKLNHAFYFYNVENPNSLMHKAKEQKTLDEIKSVFMVIALLEKHQMIALHKEAVYWRLIKAKYKLAKKHLYADFFLKYPEHKNYILSCPHLSVMRKVKCLFKGGIKLKKSWKPLN